jgi:hypothetical protein
MATTYEFIANTTVGAGGATTLVFNNIPQIYNDLVVFCSVRSDRTGVPFANNLRFNGDSGANYSGVVLQGSGTVAYSSATAASAIRIGQINGSGSTANTFTNAEVYIPNYRGAVNKAAISFGILENNATEGYIESAACIWNNTAAITSITLIQPSTNNYVQYSSATLYGIKNS